MKDFVHNCVGLSVRPFRYCTFTCGCYFVVLSLSCCCGSLFLFPMLFVVVVVPVAVPVVNNVNIYHLFTHQMNDVVFVIRNDSFHATFQTTATLQK